MTPTPVPAPPGRSPLSTREVIAALDRGEGELSQALELVGAAGHVGDPGALTLGELDRELLTEHRAVFGAGLEILATCGACGTRNAFRIDPDTVEAPAPRSARQGPGAGLREPRAGDLLGLPRDPASAARLLAARCAVGPDPTERDPDLLDELDTGLHGTVTGPCVHCGRPVQAPLEVAASVLRAFAALCGAYDVEVHALAARYGWPLETIDALPDARRRRLADYAGTRP